MRNGNKRSLEEFGYVEPSSYPTYEEWKRGDNEEVTK